VTSQTRSLEELLRACVVRVEGGPLAGAGFFVGPRRVITCAHVVGTDGAPLTIRIAGGSTVGCGPPILLCDQGRPIPGLAGNYPDLALLDVDVEEHACVALDHAWPQLGDRFQAYGFPSEGGSVLLTPLALSYSGTKGPDEQPFIDLASETPVKPGMSGSPLFSERTRTVCGVVVASRNPTHADGGLAVGLSALGKHLVPLTAANRAFHDRDRRWSRAMSAQRPRGARHDVDSTDNTAHSTTTLVHISDVQFGRRHPFGNLAIGDPEADLDTVFTRLRDDLEVLAREHGLRPQVIVVSGDLAECGLPSELGHAFDLLDRLSQSLDVPRSRVVVVPGNHDVNHELCDSYFGECSGTEKSPVKPYARKWDPFRERFERFYADVESVAFTVERPWSLWVDDELRLVVAGLNSTMRESHLDEDHYGCVSEAQLRWFAGALEPYVERGWLRIGVVHHNIRHGSVDDDEHLRDSDDLSRLLGRSLNVLLHGHAHEGATDWLHPGLPVLSTGSVALHAGGHPPEVANRYQVIRLRGDRIEQWHRRYAPHAKRWEADTSCSPSGDVWHVVNKVQFAAAPEPSGAAEPSRHGWAASAGADDDNPADNTFLVRVAEVCELRYGGENRRLTVEPMRDDRGHEYVAMHVAEGALVREFPVAVAESGVSRELVSALCRDVFDRYYWTLDRSVRCEIAYGGERAPEELIEWAAARNVFLRSFVELQGIIDFRGYVERQTARLAADVLYPPRLYVPQRLEYGAGTQQVATQDALGQIMAWLREPRARLALILGDFGTGKTFLLHELARRMPAEIPHLVPVLIELRALEKAHTVEELVAQHLAVAGERYINLAAFPYMLREGRIALMFDGFDELAQRVTYQRAAEHFETILQAAGGDAKIVVTSRTQHFESDRQVRLALRQRADLVPSLTLCRLQAFDTAQIHEFLRRRLGDEADARERFALIEEIRDLLGLSSNPRMLGFIAALPAQQLRDARDRTGAITAAALYRLLINRWLEYEAEKTGPHGTGPTLSKAQRLEAVTAIALRLWSSLERTIHISELSADIREAASSLTAPDETGALDPDQIAHIVGSRTLLVRDDDELAFAHQSVMEWLVANHAARRLADGHEPEALAQAPMTALMIDFFCDLTGSDHARQWATETLHREDGSLAATNALGVLEQLGERISGASLVGQRLAGRDLSARDLRGTDFADVDLTEAQLTGSDLTDANLSRAVLARADLTGAILAGAVLDGADVRGASLVGADLHGAKLDRTTLRRAKLTAARLDTGALSGCDTFGAAPADDLAPEPIMGTPALPAMALAFHPAGDLLVTGHNDGSIRLWDPAAGVELRVLSRHDGGIGGLAFSRDGGMLASAGGDGTVRIWDPIAGTELYVLDGHDGAARAVAFSPQRDVLASGGDDRAVRLWDPLTGDPLNVLVGHQGAVRGVAFSPVGHMIASASDDATTRVWDPAAGTSVVIDPFHEDRVRGIAFSPDGMLVASVDDIGAIRIYEPESRRMRRYSHHEAGAWDVCFSPDGSLLATAGRDGVVRLWDPATMLHVRALEGHRGGIHQVSFTPDGRALASAGDDSTVRLWDPATGAALHTLKGHDCGVWGVSFAPTGNVIASASDDGGIRLWDPISKTGRSRFGGRGGRSRSVAFSPDGGTLASCSDDGSIRVWNAASGTEPHTLKAHSGVVEGVAFAPDGRMLASTGFDCTVHLWEPGTGACRTLSGHTLPVRGVTFSPDGRILATASQDGTVRLWNVATGLEKRLISSDQAWLWGISCAPDGSMFAAAGDGCIGLWDAATGDEISMLNAHYNELRAVAFSPDGSLLASTGRDGEVTLWDPAARVERHRLRGHRAEVLAVTFSPDGRMVASGSRDGTVRLWDPSDGELLCTLGCLANGWVSFAPGGRYKLGGDVGGGFWYTSGLCRFAPGELDRFIGTAALVRVDTDEPL
jgi:WD40 repeat protein/uncharacterized protein YjbI with pentapeptide repeats/3',5'-cyclic AMP phosphodiesterase CpdA